MIGRVGTHAVLPVRAGDGKILYGKCGLLHSDEQITICIGHKTAQRERVRDRITRKFSFRVWLTRWYRSGRARVGHGALALGEIFVLGVRAGYCESQS